MRLSLISQELGAEKVWPSNVRLRIRDCFAAFLPIDGKGVL